jgi:hypothetical protein
LKHTTFVLGKCDIRLTLQGFCVILLASKMERKEGRGMRPGAPTSQEGTRPKEQGSYRPDSASRNPSGTLSSIRADQDVETFVAGLRQNKEQLLSLARIHKIKPADTRDETWDNLALGTYLEVAMKETYLSTSQREINPGDYLDEDSDEPLTEAERRETLAFWATERVALKWLDTHPDSEAAKEVAHWNIYGFPDQHQRLLQEMWPAILPQLASVEESPAFRVKAENFLK